MKAISLYILIILLLSGCMAKTAETVTLTVHYPSESEFYQKYGYAFEKAYPHIHLEVITDKMNMESDASIPQPDILFMNGEKEWKQWAARGHLYDLTDRASKLKPEPSIVTTPLKDGDGRLYGVAPFFQSHAIFYNIDLFERYGIPYPDDKMTWKEILELASRFPSTDAEGTRLYGLKTNYYTYIPFATALRIGQTEGLQFIDPDTLEITFHTEGWKTVISHAAEAFKKGAVVDRENTTDYEADPILTGQAAMQLGDNGMVYNFDNYAKIQGSPPINWGMVSVPVNTSERKYSDYYQLHEIFAINAHSNWKDEAWTFIEFIVHSGEFYNYTVKIQAGGLPARTDLISSYQGHDLTPLYALEPAPYANNPYDEVDYRIINAFKQAGDAVMNRLLEEEITLEDAMKQIELQGQQAVDQAALEVRGKL